MKWHELSQKRKIAEWLRKQDEMLRSLTPSERDCMWKVNLQEMHREPIDLAAKRVFDEAVARFNQAWQEEKETTEYPEVSAFYEVRARIMLVS